VTLSTQRFVEFVFKGVCSDRICVCVYRGGVNVRTGLWTSVSVLCTNSTKKKVAESHICLHSQDQLSHIFAKRSNHLSGVTIQYANVCWCLGEHSSSRSGM
jgi:hypothetical protein